MKKNILVVLTALLTLLFTANVYALPAGEYPLSNEETEVLTVFAAQRKQPHPTFTTDKDILDTVWIFFANGEFRQFVIMDDEFQMFSCGTYTQNPGTELLINRTGKYMEGAGFQDYSSIHLYTLDTDEYSQLVTPDRKDSRVSAVFGGMEQQPFTDQSGQEKMSDTYWIFYSDETFEQYIAPENSFILFSEGTYAFRDGGSSFRDDWKYLDITCNEEKREDETAADQGSLLLSVFDREDHTALYID